MSFKQIFKDTNDYNEKSIIGFLSFAVMTLTAIIDIITGILGYQLTINEFVYNSFVITTLGSFGVSGFEKFFLRKNTQSTQTNTEEQAP